MKSSRRGVRAAATRASRTLHTAADEGGGGGGGGGCGGGSGGGGAGGGGGSRLIYGVRISAMGNRESGLPRSLLPRLLLILLQLCSLPLSSALERRAEDRSFLYPPTNSVKTDSDDARNFVPHSPFLSLSLPPATSPSPRRVQILRARWVKRS
jgi:hypothetical protein